MSKKIIIILSCVIIVGVAIGLYLAKNIDNEEEKEVEYTITYEGLKCDSPFIYLYKDGSYDYFDSIALNGKELSYVTGEYSYDIKKIISSNDKYEVTEDSTYYIQDGNDDLYEISSKNEEMIKFLDKYDLKLDKCID